MFGSHCDTKVCFIADEMAIRSNKSNNRLLQVPRLTCKILPKCMGKKISRKWFEEDLIVVPYEMQLRVLHNYNPSAPSSLVM